MSQSPGQIETAKVQDFPDRLSPMVVKELRQGLRARLFVQTIVGFHALLWIIMATASQEESSGGLSRLLWWVIALVMDILLPLRGLSVLTDERKANTMDTLVLTNLTAGRILRGKWLAIAAQISLVAISVIPYVIMCYVTGSVSLNGALLVLFRFWLGGLLLTALFVLFSWHSSWVLRAGLAIATLCFFIARHFSPVLSAAFGMDHHALTLAGSLENIASRPENAGSLTNSLPVALAELLWMSTLGFVLLEFGARLMAPTENHSGPPRTAAAALLLVAIGSGAGGFFGGTVQQGAVWVLTAVSLFALTEPVVPGGPRAAGWKRWLPLSPGLASGILFTCLAWSLVMFFVSWQPVVYLESRVYALAGSLFSARLLMLLMPRRMGREISTLLVLLVLFALIRQLLEIVGHLPGVPAFWKMAAKWVPSPLGSSGPDWVGSWLALALCLLAVPLLALRKNRDSPPQDPAPQPAP